MHDEETLEGARRRLDHAYDLARELGYQPGSIQMRELTAAEQAYQQARMRDHVVQVRRQRFAVADGMGADEQSHDTRTRQLRP